MLANDVDGDADPLTVSLVATPQHGSLTLNADGSFSYTPDAGYQGADQFSYQASDGQADSNVATVTINVGVGASDPPLAADDAYSVMHDQTLTVAAAGVLANDTSGNALTAVSDAAPAHGTLTLNADGSFSYVPASGYVGSDSFTYHANDGTADSNVATVSITVTSTTSNHRPIAVNDVYTASQDTALTIPASGLLANDADPDGDLLSAVLFKGPQHGTLPLNSDGSFSYLPNSGYAGEDSFTYQASDGQAMSSLAAVTIHVAAAPQQNLRLAGGFVAPVATQSLTTLELSALTAEGLARWELVAPNAIGRLGPVTASIHDLPGSVLGSAQGSHIAVDANAAGRGWFVDPTPASDSEFLLGSGSSLTAQPGSAAAQGVDLLTVVMHEIGHLLGLNDKDPTAYPEDLMASELSSGVRKLPEAVAIDAIFGDQA